MAQYSLYIKRAEQLVTISSKGELWKKERDMNDVQIIRNGSMLVDKNGRIVAIGEETEIEKKYPHIKAERVVDAKGKCIVPGL